MTNETRELLYNKTADELTTKERDYLYQICVKDHGSFLAKGTGYSILTALISANILLPIITGVFQPLVLLSCTIISGLFGIVLGGGLLLSSPSLKKLGLNRKEWKELKKSKRIKKINEIVNEFDYNRRLEIGKQNARLDEIISKHSYSPINVESSAENIEQVEEDKVSLILKMTKDLSNEEKSSLITKLINEKEYNIKTTIIDSDRVEESHREKDYLQSDNLPYDELDEDTIDDIETVISNLKNIYNE